MYIIVSFPTFQFVCGLVTFLIPGLANDLRIRYLPLHQFFGMCVSRQSQFQKMNIEKLAFTIYFIISDFCSCMRHSSYGHNGEGIVSNFARTVSNPVYGYKITMIPFSSESELSPEGFVVNWIGLLVRLFK